MPASIEAFIRKKATDFILLAHFSKLVEMGSKEAEKIPLSLSLTAKWNGRKKRKALAMEPKFAIGVRNRVSNIHPTFFASFSSTPY